MKVPSRNRTTTNHHDDRPDGAEALEDFVAEVNARHRARTASDQHLRTHHPTAAAAIDRTQAAHDTDHRRRLAAAEADAHRRYAPKPQPGTQPRGGPASYAEVMAQVDQDERQRLLAWEAAMERHHNRTQTAADRHHHQTDQHLARAERLIAVEHDLALRRQHHHYRQQRRLQRNATPIGARAGRAWLAIKILSLLGIVYVFALACVITIAANHLDPQPSPEPATPSATRGPTP